MDLLTIKETAEILRVSPITVRRYIASGKLAAERVGRGIRVRRAAIEDFVTPIGSQTDSAESQGVARYPSIDSRDLDENWVEIVSRSSPTGSVWVPIDQLDEYLDEHASGEDDSLRNIIGIGRSSEPTNIAEHKHEYVADAIAHWYSDEQDQNLVKVFSPSSPGGVEFVPYHELGKPTTEDDPLWTIIGIANSQEPNDVASNKHKHLVDAILAIKSME